MRLTLYLLGREVLAIAVEQPALDVGPGEHDNTCAQVELAGDVPIGFHVQANPSLDRLDDPPCLKR